LWPKRIVEYTNSHIKLHKYSEIIDLGIFVKFNMRIGIFRFYNAFVGDHKPGHLVHLATTIIHKFNQIEQK